MWSNRVVLDALKVPTWPRETLVLQPGKPSARSFIEAAVAPEEWPRTDAVLGASVTGNLHPVTIGAIARLVANRTGRFPKGAIRAAEPMSDSLADWLSEVAVDPARYALPAKRLSYVFASGAHRARAISRTLHHIAHRPIVRVVDNGTAAGVIPWLLRADLPEARQFALFEPEERYCAALHRLWLNRSAQQSYSVSPKRAQDADFASGADLVMVCHCLLLVPPDRRREVLDRARRSLNPGGVLLVNERLRDDSSSPSERQDLVHREELVSIMPGSTRVFSRRSDWTKPEDLRRVSAKSLGYSGIVVSARET